MNKLLLIAILSFVLLASVLVYNHFEKSEINPKATIQYSNPIGPTQTSPYQLDSEYIGDVKSGGLSGAS